MGSKDQKVGRGDRAATFAELPKPSSANEEIDAAILNEWGNLDNGIRIKLMRRRLKKDGKMKVVILVLLESWFVWCFVKGLRFSSPCVPKQKK